MKANLFHQKDPSAVKFEVANEHGVSLKNGYNGELSSREAGKVGGQIGGSMVKEMIRLAEESLAKKGK
ncbi:small acid soluble protein [Bacillus sp. SG-1]|nr:small acid soluble protein [Bacillus sp. SG-1]